MQCYDSPNLLPALEQALDSNPVIVPSDLRLSEAIAQMSQSPNRSPHPSQASPHRASCVLAIENSHLAGVLTERDIVRLTAENHNLDDLTVGQVMTRQVVTLNLSISPDLSDALQLLRQYHIRHLPIVNDRHYPIGIVTTESIRRALQPSNLLKFWSAKDVMSEQVICAPPTASVLKIAQLITEHRVSCAVIAEAHPVQDEEYPTTQWRPLGIITERDIVRFGLLKLDLANTQAWQVMSAPLVCLSPTDSLWEVQQQMQDLHVRRLVVTGTRGELQGIVTQTSLLQAIDPTESHRVIETLRQELEDRSSRLEQTEKQLQRQTDERELLVEKLHTSEAEMRAVFEAMTDIVLAIDLDGNSVNIMPTQAMLSDKLTAQVAELTAEQFFPDRASISELVHAQSFSGQVRRALATGKTIEFEYGLTLDTSNKSLETEERIFWFVASISPTSETSAIWVARNITHRKRIERALFEEKELAQVTLQSIGDAVITTDATGRIQYFNPIAEKLTGWSAREAARKPLGDVFKIVSEETGDPVKSSAEKVLRDGLSRQSIDSLLVISRDGTESAINKSVTPIQDRQGRTIGAVLVFRDVTASRQRARQLSWEATHDLLTGLCNRRAFELELREVLSKLEEADGQHTLCYLDLDRFKIINDTCGHAAGDELLRQVTALFQKQTRTTDTLARLGGDEFALLLHGCPPRDARRIAEKLRHSLEVFEFVWEDRTFTIGVSIGIVEIDLHNTDIAEIMRAADGACYAAKAQGRNSVCVDRHGQLKCG